MVPWMFYPYHTGFHKVYILGPILFSIYINKLSDLVDCGIVLYADDTVLFHHEKHTLQRNLNLITDWCNDNLLTINVKKYHSCAVKIHSF